MEKDDECYNCSIQMKEFDYNPTHHPNPRKNLMYSMYVGLCAIIVLLILYVNESITNQGFLTNRLVTNVYMFVFLSIFCDLLGNLYTMAKGKDLKCDNKLFDVWTLSHFVFHTLLTLIAYFFVGNFWFSIIISMLFAVGWETFEALVVDRYVLRNFACETIGNKISDLIANLLGSIFAILFI